MNDLRQTLPKIGPQHSSIHEKQAEIVKLIKNFEIKPQLHWMVNQNIPGLRKKNFPFSKRPASQRWFRPFHSYERNGCMNWHLSANWARIVYPLTFAFFAVYMMNPVMHGSIYIQQWNNFQWESVYPKLNWNRPPIMTQCITRVA